MEKRIIFMNEIKIYCGRKKRDSLLFFWTCLRTIEQSKSGSHKYKMMMLFLLEELSSVRWLACLLFYLASRCRHALPCVPFALTWLESGVPNKTHYAIKKLLLSLTPHLDVKK